MADTPLDVLVAGENQPMTYEDFLDKVIETGIDAARDSYGEDSEKFRGSKAGFEECKGKQPEDLKRFLAEAREDQQRAYRENADDYWYWNCRSAEVEWVCNVVSAVLMSAGNEVLVPPTYRGVNHAISILTRRV